MEARGRSAWLTLALCATCATCAACAQGGGRVPSDASSPDAGGTDAAGDAGAVDAGADAGGPDAAEPDAGGSDAAMADAGAVDAGAIDAGGAGCAPTAGSLAIVEVMISSRSGAGDLGEWFEAVNTADCAVDLTGVAIVSPTGGGAEQSHTIAGGTVVAPGQHFVFALSGDPADNHLLPHDYVYGTGSLATDVVMNNDSDWLELRTGATVIDRVAWPSGGFTHSRARHLAGTTDPAANDDWSTWCDSTTVYSDAGGTFYGTPQDPNETCP